MIRFICENQQEEIIRETKEVDVDIQRPQQNMYLCKERRRVLTNIDQLLKYLVGLHDHN